MKNNKTIETIVHHMNNDHKVSLYDYLAYYSNIRLSIDNPQQDVELVDVKLDKLTLNYKDSGVLKSIVIPLEPPMKDFGESRTRFVQMAFVSADSLKKSPYRITSFQTPDSFLDNFGYFFFGTFVTILVSTKFNPAVGSYVASWSPTLFKLINIITYPVLTIHLVEFVIKVLPNLRYHRAPLRLHLIYFLLTIFVGFPAWKPLERKVRALAEQRSENEKKKVN